MSEILVWSRMQAEAGQPLEKIISRKELERQAGGGLFFWGVGNAPARAISRLAKLRHPIAAVFSTMKTKPKAADVSPGKVVAWQHYVDSDGSVREIPKHVLVTSRGTSLRGSKQFHYALVCYSAEPLALGDFGPFDPTCYKNYGGSGAPIGSSQVTALLTRSAEASGQSPYRVNLRAELTGGYWVRLINPVEMSDDLRQELSLQKGPVSLANWINLVQNARRSDAPQEAKEQPLLL